MPFYHREKSVRPGRVALILPLEVEIRNEHGLPGSIDKDQL